MLGEGGGVGKQNKIYFNEYCYNTMISCLQMYAMNINVHDCIFLRKEKIKFIDMEYERKDCCSKNWLKCKVLNLLLMARYSNKS